MSQPSQPRRAMPAVLVVVAAVVLLNSSPHGARADDAPASQVAKVKLSAGATKLDDKAAAKGLGGALQAFAKERKLEPGTGAAEVFSWSGAGYKVGRAGVARAALERALKDDGYEVQNFGRDQVTLNPFDFLARGDGTYELGLSSVDDQFYFVAVNADKKRTLVGVWCDQVGQKRQVLAVAEAGFKAANADPPPLVKGDRVILVKDVNDVMKGVAAAKMPEPRKMDAAAGRARGTALDLAGKPLEGVKVVVESSAAGGFVTSVTATTDAKGEYDVEVPKGVCKVVSAGYAVKSDDKTLTVQLHPIDGECEHFSSARGGVEHFVLRTHGAVEKGGGARYGGSVRALWFEQSIPAGGTIEVTLTANGKQLDGTEGYTFVIRVPNKGGGDVTFNNIPLGRYKMTARLLEDGEAVPVRMRRPSGDGNPEDGLTVEFESAGPLGVKRFDAILSF